MNAWLAVALLLAAAPKARRVTDDNGCDKGIDENNELDGEIVCKRGGVKTYEGMYKHGKREGVAKTWRDTGKLASVEHFVNGERSGLCEEYRFDTGALEESCNYQHDKKDGVCKEYDREGKLSRERRYVSGEQRGPFTEYYDDGKVREKGTLDDQGRKDGLHERFRKDGSKEEATPWVHGKQQGTEKEWYPNGQLKEQTEWKDGERHGLVQRWHDNGQQSEVWCEQSGKRAHGNAPCTGKSGPDVQASWYANGKVRELTTWVNGVREGESASFDSEGKPQRASLYKADKLDGPEKTFRNGKLEREVTFKAGKRDGTERVFFEDGTKSEEMVWKDGVRGARTTWWMNGKKKLLEVSDGPTMKRQQWHDTGELAREETLADERREGLYREWTDKAVLIEESTWKRGKRDGMSKTFFAANGKPRLEETYTEGVRTAAKEWDEKGAVVRDERYNADGSRK